MEARYHALKARILSILADVARLHSKSFWYTIMEVEKPLTMRWKMDEPNGKNHDPFIVNVIACEQMSNGELYEDLCARLLA
jgi:hypothetical protein